MQFLFFLAGCDVPPSHVVAGDIDSALAQGRLKTVCRGLDMAEDDTRRFATERLRTIEGEPIVQECICSHLTEPDGKWDAAVVAGMKGEDNDELVSCFADLVKNQALPKRVEAITALQGMPAPVGRQVLADIAAGAGTPEERVLAIEAIAGDESHQAAFVKMLEEEDATVRAAGAKALQGIAGDDVVAALVKAYENDEDGGVRANALMGLKRAGVPEADEMLCKAMMADESAEVRKRAIMSFRGTKRDEAISCIRKRALTAEDDGSVRKAMLTVLKSSPRDSAAKVLCDAIPFWLRTYNKEEIPHKVPNTDIIKAQNDRDYENSYSCLQRAVRSSRGYSCYAKMYAAWWFEQVGGSAHIPKCPGYEVGLGE